MCTKITINGIFFLVFIVIIWQTFRANDFMHTHCHWYINTTKSIITTTSKPNVMAAAGLLRMSTNSNFLFITHFSFYSFSVPFLTLTNTISVVPALGQCLLAVFTLSLMHAHTRTQSHTYEIERANNQRYVGIASIALRNQK